MLIKLSLYYKDHLDITSNTITSLIQYDTKRNSARDQRGQVPEYLSKIGQVSTWIFEEGQVGT